MGHASLSREDVKLGLDLLGISLLDIHKVKKSESLSSAQKKLNLLKHADKIDRKYINKLVPDKPFYLEPDASPKKLKQASIEELKYLAKTNKKLSSKIYKVIDIIEKFYS